MRSSSPTSGNRRRSYAKPHFDSGCSAYETEFVGLFRWAGIPRLRSDRRERRSFSETTMTPRDISGKRALRQGRIRASSSRVEILLSAPSNPPVRSPEGILGSPRRASRAVCHPIPSALPAIPGPVEPL